MNHHAKTMQSHQPANDIQTDKPKVEQPKVEQPKAEQPKAEQPKAEQPKAEQPLVTELKSPSQQTANRMPARADNLFTMGKRHV